MRPTHTYPQSRDAAPCNQPNHISDRAYQRVRATAVAATKATGGDRRQTPSSQNCETSSENTDNFGVTGAAR